MPAKNGTTTTFIATGQEKKIIDQMMRINYTKSKSEVIRMLINAGAEKLLKKETKKN